MQQNTINQEVNITAISFQNGPDLRALPRRMEWKGQTYTFREGLQKFIGRGSNKVHIFDMTDGSKHYHLMADAEQSNWTLVNIVSAV